MLQRPWVSLTQGEWGRGKLRSGKETEPRDFNATEWRWQPGFIKLKIKLLRTGSGELVWKPTLKVYDVETLKKRGGWSHICRFRNILLIFLVAMTPVKHTQAKIVQNSGLLRLCVTYNAQHIFQEVILWRFTEGSLSPYMTMSCCRFSVETESVHFELQTCHGAIKDWKHEMALCFWLADLILLCADPHFCKSWTRQIRKGNNRNFLGFIKQWSCWSSACFRGLNPFLSQKKQTKVVRKVIEKEGEKVREMDRHRALKSAYDGRISWCGRKLWILW